MAPEGDEMVGDVSNVTFSNGWIAEDDGTVFIYYAFSDLRMHVAISSIEKLLDYVISTPEDGFTSEASVKTIMKIIEQNDSTEGRDGEEPTKIMFWYDSKYFGRQNRNTFHEKLLISMLWKQQTLLILGSIKTQCNGIN
jgi:hypothetical protein